MSERSFDAEHGEESQVISERTRKRREALERTREARRQMLEDPAIKARTREVLDQMAGGDKPKEPGITKERLPDFLREHNS